MGQHHGIPMIDDKDAGYYDHLNVDDRLTVAIDIEVLAKMVGDMNYGDIRFLAAMVRDRRVRLAERIAQYRERGDADDIAANVERTGDPLADGIAALLKQGHY